MLFSRDAALGLIRHAITFAGGALVVKGYIDDTGLTEAAAAIATLIGVVWSVFDKKGR
jgi:hypothetical protein